MSTASSRSLELPLRVIPRALLEYLGKNIELVDFVVVPLIRSVEEFDDDDDDDSPESLSEVRRTRARGLKEKNKDKK